MHWYNSTAKNLTPKHDDLPLQTPPLKVKSIRKMRIAIFSDVHGNLPALELFLNNTKDCDEYIFLGDAVNYGPWGNECVQLIKELNPLAKIMGNHEEYFLAGKYSGSNIIPTTFFEYCFPRFELLDEINTYAQSQIFKNFFLTHTIDGRTIFPDTEITIEKNYMIGHSHKQHIMTQNNLKLINPGSVGQNRTNINIINYTTLNTQNMEFKQESIHYDSNVIINEMESLGFPELCINYYKGKQKK